MMKRNLLASVGLWTTFIIFSYYQLISCTLRSYGSIYGLRGCSYGEFKCKTTSQCIRASYVCDGDRDCLDGSDEATCLSRGLPCSGFTCLTAGNCIRTSQVCDGSHDCLGKDHSDEANCTCEVTQFRCNQTIRHFCVDESAVCDAGWDCPDGSDEFPDVCEQRGCAPTAFQCKDHRCISKDLVCNRYKECNDGSDEDWEACPCNNTPHHKLCHCQPGHQIQFSRHGLQSCEDFDECSVNTCDHFCKNFKGSHECSCDEGYVLNSDNKSCSFEGNQPLLLYVWHSVIMVSSVNFTTIIPIQVDGEISGFDMHSHSNTIYWISLKEGVIGRKTVQPPNVPNTDQEENDEILFKGLHNPRLIALDWVSNNLFVVTRMPALTSIMICHVGHDPLKYGCATLYEILGDGVTITGIVACPYRSHIFWTQINRNDSNGSKDENSVETGAIWKANMDGSQMVELAAEMIHPVGLVIHHVFERILWIDSGTKTVESINFDGSNRTVVMPMQDRDWGSVQGLAIIENTITWFEDDTSFSCTSSGLKQHPSLLSNDTCFNITSQFLSEARNPKILHPALQPKGIDPCENNFCEFICTTISGHNESQQTLIETDSVPVYKYKCLCPDGFSSEDQDNIDCEPENSTDSTIDVKRIRPNSKSKYRPGEDGGGMISLQDDSISSASKATYIICNTSASVLTAAAVMVTIAVILLALMYRKLKLATSRNCDQIRARTYIELQSENEGFKLSNPAQSVEEIGGLEDDGDI